MNLKPLVDGLPKGSVCPNCKKAVPFGVARCAFCGAEINKKTEVDDSLLSKTGFDMIFISDPYNLRYFTGFRGGEGLALITPREKVLLVDSRYTVAAKEETAEKGNGFKVFEFNNNNPKYKILADIFVEYSDNILLVGFEDKSITVGAFHELSKGIHDAFNKYYSHMEAKNRNRQIEWRGLGDFLEQERMIKTPEEIEILKKAEAIGDAAFSDILGILKPGMTELEVAAELEYSMKKRGAEGLSFDTIVASGINSSMPHAIPGNKKIEVGDFVTMDFGCIYNGYCSDMTRTVVIGKASDEQKKIYDIVLKAQLEAVAYIKAGLKCIDVDRVARDIIAKEGYGEYFGHGLGHSVGLYIHELPALNVRDETILAEGMIETIEPGIYIPGFGGVRIEDMGVVTKDGYDNFASSTKELVEI